MSEQTEKHLKEWKDNDRDICDDVHHHFGDEDMWDWCEISDEGRRVWGLMFGEVVENDSPIDAILGGIAAQAAHGAFAAVAAALGVDADDVKIAASYWTEGLRTDPVGVDGFMKMIQELAAERLSDNSGEKHG